jgi:type IV secretion system protein VirB10
MDEPIKDKAPKPPGLLPKNLQSWVIVAIALVMILIMWLTGGRKPQSTTRTAAALPLLPAPAEVNEVKIAGLQRRIQDLQKEQLAAQTAITQENRLLGAVDKGQGQGSATGNTAVTPEDAIKTERRKREYLSLFASNIALSYRKHSSNLAAIDGAPEIPPNPTSQAPDLRSLGQLLQPAPPPAAVAQQSIPATNNTVLGSRQIPPAPSADKDEKGSEAVLRNAATGKTYLLFEGTILETVLINRLDGQFSGPVACLLATDVYSHDRQHLLLPVGTKVLGQTRKIESLGQTRLAVVFHRLILPDGFSVSLDQFKGLDQIGDTGLRDLVNNHYLRIFGTSLAIGGLGAVAQAGTGSALTATGTDLMRQGFAASTAQSASQILDRFLNILPTVTIREGHRIKVYLSGDLALPDYANHTMPSDL